MVVDADCARAEQVARDINNRSDSAAGAEAIAADVSVSADVRRYIAAAAARGPVDLGIHAASVAGPAAPMPDFDEAQFNQIMAINARGTLLGLKYALPQMHRQDPWVRRMVRRLAGAGRAAGG